MQSGRPDFSLDLTVAPNPSLEAVVSRFEVAHREPDSPVRAVHHQAATEGEYADIPDSVDPRLRAALEKRGPAVSGHEVDEHLALGVNIAWYPGFTHHVTWAALWDFMQDFNGRGSIAALARPAVSQPQPCALGLFRDMSRRPHTCPANDPKHESICGSTADPVLLNK